MKDKPSGDLVSPWHPITDPQELKLLGKTAEETNELGSALARSIIQGFHECHPLTGKMNRTWVEEEIADVLASTRLLRERYHLNNAAIASRAEHKYKLLCQWQDGLTGETK
jgi:hypothetical protein